MIEKWLMSDTALAVLAVGALFLFVAWPMVVARLTRYSRRDHDRAYLKHKRKEDRK